MLNTSDLYPVTVGLAQPQSAASAGGGTAGVVLDGDHRRVRVDRPADRRLPVPAALLVVRSCNRKREGLIVGEDAAETHARSFEIGDEDFLLDGEPFRILSGAIHYFRVHPEQWTDRIREARLMGLNTIETYVAWNAHEPLRGEWDATGWNDLGAFLDAIAAEGMYAIVRPGPYICAEWTNGGLRGVADRRRRDRCCGGRSLATSRRRPALSRMSTRSSPPARSTAAGLRRCEGCDDLRCCPPGGCEAI